MSSTMPQLSLSPVYRHAQRVLGAWLEQAPAAARRRAFGVRGALVGLDPVERHRLARWLAWLCVAAQYRRIDLAGRIRLLDGALHRAVAAALGTLPQSARPGVSAARSRSRHA
jgi:hypothetical protein